MSQRVLILGADGFIGRHLAFAFRREGWDVTACARRTNRLAQMGFHVVKADLTDAEVHDTDFWRAHLAGGVHIVNAAGLLTGSAAQFEAVHVKAPSALYRAREDGARAILISAVGIDADTAFSRWRRAGETCALDANVTVLRAGLVVGDTSYGGSSLLRALAAFPVRTPVIGDGKQPFNPVHVDDLAHILIDRIGRPFGPVVEDIGGGEVFTQAELIQTYRRWLGLREQPMIHLPERLARGLGRIGDLLKLGPLSATAVQQMSAGVLARLDPDVETPPGL
ncbi:MAG: NAD-dependent epimerase/dehydratase family protein, partial [Deltaproteobacteria bacterium]